MKRFFMKNIIFVILGLFVLSACSKKEQSQTAGPSNAIRWAYWGAESRVKRSQEAIAVYQSQNSGVFINPEVSGGTGDHFTKVDTQLAGGNGHLYGISTGIIVL